MRSLAIALFCSSRRPPTQAARTIAYRKPTTNNCFLI
jgi:hypothetical protein